MNSRENRQVRSVTTNLKTRSQDDGEMVIEGYFAVFNSETELFRGAYEEVDSTAFNKTLNNDIKALINHDTTLVLGRNKSNTLDLSIDKKGLWGSIKINKNDSDAVNLYERVKRGDIDQCSFGFQIIEEETEQRDDGAIKWKLKEVDLHEVSVVTFPAYADTAIHARKKDFEQIKKRKLEQQKMRLRERLNNGA